MGEVDRHIEVTGSAWFSTRPVMFPVELALVSSRQASNVERLKLARAMKGLVDGLIEGGIPAARFSGGDDLLSYLAAGDDHAPRARALAECTSAEELGQLHGLATRIDHGEGRLTVTDGVPIVGEHPADRAAALARAASAAMDAATAVAGASGLKVGQLLSAREMGARRREEEVDNNRVRVMVRARFEIL